MTDKTDERSVSAAAEGEAETQRRYIDILREELAGSRPLSYTVVTFGCQMNARDSEKLSGILEAIGMRGDGG